METEKEQLSAIMPALKDLAVQYYELTGKPIGITGEYGEWLAADVMGWELAEARAAGYDAIAPDGALIQIKTRAVDMANKNWRAGMMGKLRLDQPFDRVALVVMDKSYTLHGIWLAERADLEKAITAPGSKARTERGALSLGKVISISEKMK